MRREWIEMNLQSVHKTNTKSLPPCGGSGLKYKTNTKNTRLKRLPPCGGSGLKYKPMHQYSNRGKSPSMRREWIEINHILLMNCKAWVSLHAEGVD